MRTAVSRLVLAQALDRTVGARNRTLITFPFSSRIPPTCIFVCLSLHTFPSFHPLSPWLLSCPQVSPASVAKRLPMEDPIFIDKLRIGYVSAQVFAILIYLGVMYRVSPRYSSRDSAFEDHIKSVSFRQLALLVLVEQGLLASASPKTHLIFLATTCSEPTRLLTPSSFFSWFHRSGRRTISLL